MPDVDEILVHYGKKGMKWGVRKAKAPASEDSAKVSAIKTQAKKQGKHTLSNKQLEEANKRLGLEQQFSKSTKKPKSALRNAGEKAAIGLIASSGTLAVKSAAKNLYPKAKQLYDVIDWQYVLEKA